MFAALGISLDNRMMASQAAADGVLIMDQDEFPTSRAFDPPAEAEWHRMIAEVAYFRSQKPEFSADGALDHWPAAEMEVWTLLSGRIRDARSEPTSTEQGDAGPAPPLSPMGSNSKNTLSGARRRNSAIKQR
jgi:hypothetical protein